MNSACDKEYKNIQREQMSRNSCADRKVMGDGVIFGEKKSIACKLKKECSIKLTLHRACSMLSRGDVSGNCKFPVVNRGGLVRGRLAGRKKDLSLTMSHTHTHTHIHGRSLFLYFVSLRAESVFVVGGDIRDANRDNIPRYNIPRELDCGVTTSRWERTHTQARARTHIHICRYDCVSRDKSVIRRSSYD